MNNLEGIQEEVLWNLIHEVFRHQGELEKKYGDNSFICYCPIGRRNYDFKKLNDIEKKNNRSAVNFSELIHHMPRFRNFVLVENGDSLLEEYDQFLNTAELIYPEPFGEDAMYTTQLPDWVKDQEKENEKYENIDIELSQKREIARDIKIKLFKAGEDFSEILEELKELNRHIRANRNRWDIDGKRLKIEEERDKIYAIKQQNILVEWGKVKRVVRDATRLSPDSDSIEYANYTINFDDIEKDWVENINFKHKDMVEAINSIDDHFMYKKERGKYIIINKKTKKKATTDYFSNLQNLVTKVDEITIPFYVVEIVRPWLDPDVFDIKEFPWRWHKNYYHTKLELSSGSKRAQEYRGILPSYITHLVFVKNVIYKPKYKTSKTFMIDVGSFKVPKPFLPYVNNKQDKVFNKKDEVFLACFICERVPKCPR